RYARQLTYAEASFASAQGSDLGESFGAIYPLLNERPNALSKLTKRMLVVSPHRRSLMGTKQTYTMLVCLRLYHQELAWHQQAVFNRALPPLRFRSHVIKLSTVGHQPKRKLTRKMQY
ncbi:hypothetical protein F441_11525, partial [Phytophthora nicotianae CJ01A1]